MSKIQERARHIIDTMKTKVPNASCELNYDTPYQLLVAVVLSAQCTDIRVNLVTNQLFELASTPQDMIVLGETKLQEILRPVGFYRVKSSNILKLSHQLLQEHNGNVPNNRQQLESLPGVGRKTANVILMECFGEPVIAVDTHVYRVSRRLELSQSSTPEGVEQDLYANLPSNLHHIAHHTILHYGRYICRSQNPLCGTCQLTEYCNHNKSI
jgi:endonuclease-3